MTKKCTILSLSRGRPGKTMFGNLYPVVNASVGPHLL